MFSAVALGQEAASIRGPVTDPSGAVIADAMVRLVPARAIRCGAMATSAWTPGWQSCHPTERVGVRFRWDVFNVTNSTRFDVNTIGNRLDQPSTFGVYTQSLTNPRVMQVALRIEF